MGKLLSSHENTTEKSFNKKAAAIFVFALYLVRMIIMMPKGVEEAKLEDPWTLLFYAVDYKTMGVVPRGLIGSVCSLFFKVITVKSVYTISICATVVLLIILSSALYRALCRLNDSECIALLFLATLPVIGPDNPLYIFDKECFGIVDIYFIMLTPLVMRLTENKKLKWLIPLICAVCMAIYEGYFFAFGSVIAITLLYMIFKSEKKVGAVTVTVISALAVIGSFLYFYVLFRSDCLGVVPFEKSEDAVKVISAHTDMEISWMFEQLYFWDSALSFLSDGRWNISETFSSVSGVRNDCLPLFIIVYGIALFLYIYAFRKEKDKKIKAIYIFCALAPVVSLPLFAFSQQMKYIAYNVLCQIFLVTFFSSKEESFKAGLRKIGTAISKNPLTAVLCWAVIIILRILLY